MTVLRWEPHCEQREPIETLLDAFREDLVTAALAWSQKLYDVPVEESQEIETVMERMDEGRRLRVAVERLCLLYELIDESRDGDEGSEEAAE